jgi:ArsR family transcriptional regulator
VTPDLHSPVREQLTTDTAAGLAQVLKALGSVPRLVVVSLLAHAEDGLRQVQLVEHLQMNQSVVNGHVTRLREAGLITSEPKGRTTVYRLAPGALDRVASLLGGDW